MAVVELQAVLGALAGLVAGGALAVSAERAAGGRRLRPLPTALLAGAGGAYAALRFGLGWAFLFGVALCALLAAVAVTDLRTRLIPNRLLLLGVAATGPLALLAGITDWRAALIGAAACAGFLLALAIVSRNAMGGGDVKLAGLLGLVLGWRLGLLALMVGFVAAGLTGAVLILLKLKGRKDFIAFGPFIAAGGVVALFWGERLLAWLLHGA